MKNTKVVVGALAFAATVAAVAVLTTEARSQTFASHAGQLVSMARCLDVEGGVSENGRNVRIFDCNGTPAQRWNVLGRQIQHVMGRCLDVEGGVSANGRNVRIWDCNGSPAQQWIVSGQQIQNAMGRCLDVEGGVSANGRNVRIFDCNGTLAQHWEQRP